MSSRPYEGRIWGQSRPWFQSSIQPIGKRFYGHHSHSFPNPVSGMRAVYGLIGINTAVFCAWNYARMQRDNKLLVKFQENFELSWDNMNAGRYHTMLTAAFMHHDPAHFAFNMFSLYTFGSILSWFPGIGLATLVTLGIGSAAASSAAFLYQQGGYNAPKARFASLEQILKRKVSGLGASGLIEGFAGAATCLAPFVPIQLLFIPIGIPLWIATGAFIAVDYYYLDASDGIGHSAHLGGAAFGALAYVVYLRRFGGIFSIIGRRFGRLWR